MVARSVMPAEFNRGHIKSGSVDQYECKAGRRVYLRSWEDFVRMAHLLQGKRKYRLSTLPHAFRNARANEVACYDVREHPLTVVYVAQLRSPEESVCRATRVGKGRMRDNTFSDLESLCASAPSTCKPTSAANP